MILLIRSGKNITCMLEEDKDISLDTDGLIEGTSNAKNGMVAAVAALTRDSLKFTGQCLAETKGCRCDILSKWCLVAAQDPG